MANIVSNVATWSATEASNQPDDTDANTLVADMRSMQAAVRKAFALRDTIASGSTVDLSTINGLFASVTQSTGTVGISSFGSLSAGMWKLVTFAVSGGALSLVYDATAMILPTAANIAIEDGDSLLAESLGSGNWKIHIYQKSDGNNLIPPSGQVFLYTVTASNSATLDCNNLTGYKYYKLVFNQVRPVTANTIFQARISEDNGSTFQSGATAYAYSETLVSAAASTVNSSAGASVIQMTTNTGNSSVTGISGEFILINPASSAKWKFPKFSLNYLANDGNLKTSDGSGVYTSDANAINSLRFFFNSGNVSDGSIDVYGVN